MDRCKYCGKIIWIFQCKKYSDCSAKTPIAHMVCKILEDRKNKEKKTFVDFVKEVKQIAGVHLLIDKEPNRTIWVLFDDTTTLEGRNKFYEIFTDYELIDDSFDLETKLLTEEYIPEGLEEIIC